MWTTKTLAERTQPYVFLAMNRASVGTDYVRDTGGALLQLSCLANLGGTFLSVHDNVAFILWTLWPSTFPSPLSLSLQTQATASPIATSTQTTQPLTPA